jgi:acyl-CoA reductase-like NAD-dependent aldehyde dehydrogenase
MRPRIRELSSMCLPFALRALNPIKFGTSSTGQLVEPAGGKYLDNIEPARGKAYSQVADSDARDVDLAVAAAEKGFADWSRRSGTEQSRILLRIAAESDKQALGRTVCTSFN